MNDINCVHTNRWSVNNKKKFGPILIASNKYQSNKDNEFHDNDIGKLRKWKSKNYENYLLWFGVLYTHSYILNKQENILFTINQSA